MSNKTIYYAICVTLCHIGCMCAPMVLLFMQSNFIKIIKVIFSPLKQKLERKKGSEKNNKAKWFGWVNVQPNIKCQVATYVVANMPTMLAPPL